MGVAEAQEEPKGIEIRLGVAAAETQEKPKGIETPLRRYRLPVPPPWFRP